jgi:hypothetical protein
MPDNDPFAHLRDPKYGLQLPGTYPLEVPKPRPLSAEYVAEYERVNEAKLFLVSRKANER